MQKTTQVQIVMASHVNGTGRLFGGQLMAWIDVAGAVAARRYAKTDVTTVTVDTLDFLEPVHMNETVVLDAYVTWTGKTSMEVCVETYVERLGGERMLVNRAYAVYIAMDAHERKVAVPAFAPQTDAEKAEWSAAQKRRELRLLRAGR